MRESIGAEPLAPLPPVGQYCGDAWRRCAFPSRGDDLASIGQGIEVALAAGVDEAEAGGVESTSFACSGSGCGAEADAEHDDGMPQQPPASCWSVTAADWRCQRSTGPCRGGGPRQSANLLLDLAFVTLAVLLDAGQQTLDGVVVPAPLDQAPHVADQIVPEGGAGPW